MQLIYICNTVANMIACPRLPLCSRLQSISSFYFSSYMKTYTKTILRRLIPVVVWLAMASAWAQAPETGALTGTLRDKTGEVIPGASIATANGRYVTYSDQAGGFRLLLPPGRHLIQVSHLRFGVTGYPVEISSGTATDLSPVLTESTNALNDIVVSGSAMPAELRTIASNISILKAGEPELRQMRTLDDALYFIPGVNIDRNRGLTTTGTHTAVTMRGTGSANRTLILKDGVPINDAYTGGVSEWNSTATGSISRIEVVRGPGSAIHGSNSMGGTINLVTESPTGKPAFGADLRYGSMNTLQAGVKAGKAFSNGFGIIVFSEYKKTDGYQYMADSLWRDYYKTPRMQLFNLNTKLTYQLNPGSRLEAIVDHHLQLPLSGTTTIYDDKTRITNSLLRYVARKGAVNLEATGYINSQLRISDANQWNKVDKAYNKDSYDSRTPVDIYGFIGKISRRFGSHLVTTGADLKRTSSSTKRFNYSSGYQNFSGDQNFLSFFINDDLKFGSRINVNAGVRYDNWQNLNGKLYDETSGEAVSLAYGKASASVWSPKVGLVYQASQKLRLRTQFAQGFRAPAIYDLYISGPLGSFFRLGNPDLKPERMVYSVDLGGDLYLGRSLELTLTGYLSQYRDFAERVEIPASQLPAYLDPGGLPVRQFTNIGQVNLGGIESSLRYTFARHFTLIGSYFYNRSRIVKYETNRSYEGNEVSGNPRHTVSGGFVFDLPAKLNAAIWVRSTSKNFGDLENSASRVMAPVTIADLKLTYELKRFAINANVMNLFDKLYFGSYTSPASYQYAPRRSVNAGVSFHL